MAWYQQLKADPLNWLLEAEDPDVRYLALRDIVECSSDNPDLEAARTKAHTVGEVARIMSVMQPSGYWVKPGSGYYPKYQGSVWSLLMLAQLGAAAAHDERIARACAYILDHALSDGGQFSISGAPSGTADCLQGNLCAALIDLGYHDPRLKGAYEWMARTVTGEGLAPKEERDAPVRYYAGKCGPLFACGSNNKLSCAWGGVKVMLALSKLPADQRTPMIERAIQAGVDFLFSVDPATAAYPSGFADKPSGNWWKFGFPVFYVTDLLQITEALVALGHGHDPRLANALALIRDKQDAAGRWPLEYSYTGKVWSNFGDKKQPNKWVTLRALRVLKAAA